MNHGTSQLVYYLAAMAVIVPISKRLGLGAVLGYLIGGVVLGPAVLDWIGHDQANTFHIAEFGVITMLLMIGLELNPKVLWQMRGPIFGLGSAQVLVTTLAFMLGALAFGQSWQSALAIGMLVSVSSTAIVLPTLQEKGFAKSPAGESAFAVLLFQDIAVIPMLAILPILASSFSRSHAVELDARPGWLQATLVLATVGGLILAGRFLVRPMFHWVARLKLRETFTALALLLVVGTTALMQIVGLSPALGAFLAGVVLADSEFRHQIEADLDPFKGLLLGLFFISIGAGINFEAIAGNPALVLLMVLGLLVGKAVVAALLGRAFKMAGAAVFLFAFSLAQGGEFAFVLISLSKESQLLAPELAQAWTAAVAISMALAPLLIGAAIRWGMPRFSQPKVERESDVIDEKERSNPVIVIGIGRFGQTVFRLLKANGFGATVLDYDAEQVEVLARFGVKSYFGDGSRLDMLRAAGIESAKVLVLAMDDAEKTTEVIDLVKREFPHIRIFARVYDRIHAYQIIHKGVDDIVIETSGSALLLGIDILKALGFSARRSYRQGLIFKHNNDRSIRHMAKVYHEADETTFVQQAKTQLDGLEKMLQSDPVELRAGGDHSWDAPPSSTTLASG